MEPSEIEDVLSYLKTLNLEYLPDSWVKNVNDHNFDDFNELPSNVESMFDAIQVGNILSEVNSKLKVWLESMFDGQEDVEGQGYTRTGCLFWPLFLKSGVKVKSLLSLLAHFMRAGQQYDASFEICDVGFKASCFYLLFLTIPGSGAFKVFHTILYTKAVSAFNMIRKLNIGKKNSKKNSVVNTFGEVAFEDSEIDDDFQIQLSTQDSSRATRNMNHLLHNLLLFLRCFPLEGKEDCIEITVEQLVKLTRLEVNTSNFSFGQQNVSSVSSLAYNAYIGIYKLCAPLHGEPINTTKLCMKYLFTNIILNSHECHSFTTKAISVIREHTVHFIQYLSKSLKECVEGAILILIQHLCLKVPDKAEWRNKISQVVVEVLRDISSSSYLISIKFFLLLGRHESASHRYFAVEVISRLLWEKLPILDEKFDCGKDSGEGELEDFGELLSEFDGFPIKSLLLLFIITRIGDIAASVRAKALIVFGECTDPQNPLAAPVVKDITSRMKTYKYDDQLQSSAKKNSQKADDIMVTIIERIGDERVTVRKSALQVLYNLIRLENSFRQTSLIEAFSKRCSDPAPLIRKYVIQSLTNLVMTFQDGNHDFLTFWCSCVLTRVIDIESKIQEKVHEAVESLIFSNITTFEKTKHPMHRLPWLLLDLVDSMKLNKFLHLACKNLVKSNLINLKIIEILRTHIGTVHNDGAWLLLGILSSSLDIKKCDFSLNYLEESIHRVDEVGGCTMKHMFKFVYNCVPNMTNDNKNWIFDLLLAELESFNFSTDILKEIIDILHLISLDEEESSSRHYSTWSPRVLSLCHNYLKSQVILEETEIHNQQEEMIFRHLFVVGELAQVTPDRVDSSLTFFPQVILFNSTSPNDSILGSSCLPTGPLTFSVRLQGVSILTLGKICLVQESLAKEVIPAMGKLLDTSSEPLIRSNVMLVLSDMCVRYATLITPLIPLMTSCLRDSSPLVRSSSLVLVIHLLQEDYLKLKGDFFYRLLSQLCDPDQEIQNIINFYISQRLLKKYPKILFQHFVEAIFHFNGYKGHDKYNKFAEAEREQVLLQGPAHKSSRLQLYKFMLENMNDEERFQVFYNLCRDILGGVLEDKIPLTCLSYPVINDALEILSCEEIKLASLKCRPEEENLDQDLAGAVIATAKTTIISNVVKRNVLENILPIIMKFKAKLNEENSPLYPALLICMKELLKDYKNEIKPILVGDRELAKEIQIGLKRYEQEQRGMHSSVVPEEANSRASDKTPMSDIPEADPAVLRESTISDQDPKQATPNSSFANPVSDATDSFADEEFLLKPKKVVKKYQAKKRPSQPEKELEFKDKPGNLQTYSKRSRKLSNSSIISDSGLCELDLEDVIFHGDDRCMIKIKKK